MRLAWRVITFRDWESFLPIEHIYDSCWLTFMVTVASEATVVSMHAPLATNTYLKRSSTEVGVVRLMT